jgi:hypothetical protein
VFLSVFGGSIFPVFPSPDLDGPNDCSHVMDARPLAASPSANQAFVNLNGMLPANAIPLRADHPGPKLVKDLEGSFIAGEPELALELKRRLAWGLGCHQITRPKPG